MNQKSTRHPLHQPFTELLSLQQQLLVPSKYYGYLLQKLLGTDTIPFLLRTTEGTIFQLANALNKSEAIYFRLEAVEEKHILVSLLRAFTVEGEDTVVVKEVAWLEKTMATAYVKLTELSAIQLVDARLLSSAFFIESKW